MTNSDIYLLTKSIREDIVDMCYRLGNSAGHLGGCMSLVELLAVLYGRELKFDPNNLTWESRDRVIMSKGQGSIAMYAAMHQIGMLADLSIAGNLLGEETPYYKQSVRNPEYGIEFSSGSLGQGLAYGVGIAWALKNKNNSGSKVFVILGDGECNEGSVWEAASLAGHLKLDNLIVIVDYNGLQIDGNTKDINCLDSLKERWDAFGFHSLEIDGHDIDEITKAYRVSSKEPLAIIAKTTKGKGIHFAENQVEWHQNVLTSELYRLALEDIRNGENENASI